MYCAEHNTALALCVSKVKIYINGSGGAPIFLLWCVLLIKVNTIIKVLEEVREYIFPHSGIFGLVATPATPRAARSTASSP